MKKPQVVAIVCTVIMLIVILVNLERPGMGGQYDNEFNIHQDLVLEPLPVWIPLPVEPTWIPTNWTGIPLSVNNPFWVDPDLPEVQLAREQMYQDIVASSGDKSEAFWRNITDHYEHLIGWNGIYDAVNTLLTNLKAQGETTLKYSRPLHMLGELLSERCKGSVRHRYAVEISSRVILMKAPLPGLIWKAINNSNLIVNPPSLFTFLDTELCFFKDVEGMGTVWISCIHGAGHGLALAYGPSKIKEAVQVCSYRPEDPDWMYSCATGIYMELVPYFPVDSFAPCDTLEFPATCFRFKYSTFKLLQDNHISLPCRTQTNEYQRRGCIFGEAYVQGRIRNHTAPRQSSRQFCAKYQRFPHYLYDLGEIGENHYVACLEGYYQSQPIFRFPDTMKEKECLAFESMEIPRAVEICNKHASMNPLDFTFDEEGNQDEQEETIFWEYDLLEEFHTSNAESAEWIPVDTEHMIKAPPPVHVH